MGVIPYPMSQYYPLRKLLRGRGSLLGFNIVFRQPSEGAVDWLLSCPEKGFFVAIESDSDSL